MERRVLPASPLLRLSSNGLQRFIHLRLGSGSSLDHKRTQDRIDKVMDEHVKRIEFNDTINSLRSDIKEGNRGVQERLDNLLQTLIEKK